MQAPLMPPDEPREIYSQMNQCHLCLKSWEQVRGENAEADVTKKYYENLTNLFQRKCIPEQAVNEAFALMRSDAGGVEGVHRTVERNFLNSIKRAVLYYAKTSQFSDWEADAKDIVAAMKKQKEQCELIVRIPQLSGMYPASLLPLINQDLEEHQDQFSVTYFSCAKRAVEDFKETYRQLFARILGGNNTAQKPVIVMQSPLQYHSIDCMGNYDMIRKALEDAQLDDSKRTVETPEISNSIKAFAQSFKKVKEIGMQISLEGLAFNIAMNSEILTQFKSEPLTPPKP